MPIYEYLCASCGKEFEKLMRSSDTPECPACHGHDLKKKLSVFATATASTGAGSSAMPEGCASCGHPGGPGACAYSH